MRRCLFVVAAAALGGCRVGAPANRDGDAEQAAPASTGFPQAGNYHIVHDSGQGAQSSREESDMWVDASDAGKFEELVAGQSSSNCRDREVQIGKGSFNVSMTCDAPDGDIHNIRMERHGSYSEGSIDISDETSFWGMAIRESRSYRLKA